jgi:hypothetical protein
LIVRAPLARERESGGKKKRFFMLTPQEQMGSLAEDLCENIPVNHKVLVRTDFWSSKYLDFLLKFGSAASKPTDYVSEEDAALLTPKGNC